MSRIERFRGPNPGLPVVGQPAKGGEYAIAGDALARAGFAAMGQIQDAQERQRREQEAAAEKAQAQRDTLGVERIVAEAETWADQTFQQMADNAAPGADGFEQQVGEAWTQQRAKLISDTGGLSPFAREMLATRLDTRVGGQLATQASRFAMGSRVAKTVDDFDVVVASKANRVISNPDAHDEEATDLAGLLTILDLPADRRAKIAGSMRATLAKAAVAGQIDRDPAMALQWLDSGRFDKGLSPNDKISLRNASETAIKHRENEAKQAAALARAEMRAELSDTVAALRSGRRVQYDADRIMATMGEQAGQAAVAELHQAEKFGADAVAVQWASPDELQAMLASRQAVQVGKAHPVTGRPIIRNDDGTISTEESITVTDERLNSGKPTNIPSIWGGRRPPAELDDAARENWAVEQALKSGQTFEAFGSIDAAVKAAEARTAKLGETANDIRGWEDRQQELNALSGLVARRAQALDADPAAYVAQAPAVRDRWQAYEAAEPEEKAASFAAYVTASMAEQERLGVPAAQVRVLPKERAALQVAELSRAKPEDAADMLSQQAALYGRHWPAAYRDMVKAGMPREYQVLATTTDAAGRAALAAALSQDKDALRQAAGADAKEIDQTVTGALAPLYRSLSAAPDGQDIAAGYEKAARLLAYRYAAQGMDAGEAATKAANDVALGRWDFVESGRQAMARAPKGLGARAQRWGDIVMSRTDAAAMADPGDPRGVQTGYSVADRQEIALNGARRGAWLTMEDGSGWFRVHEDGQPVFLSDGNRLEFRFADIDAAQVMATEVPKVRYGR
jgi:hypothetical protein